MTTARLLLARPHRGRLVHLVESGLAYSTLCGREAALMAKWSPADAVVDNKPRPLCETCRILAASHVARHQALGEIRRSGHTQEATR